ncbi:MAG: twin-arginine translocase subunit TatB [Gammaproteobacteria bacterium]|nr:twin-arginine translocase subunit TatB [Gammaproteobacteria bacterium]
MFDIGFTELVLLGVVSLLVVGPERLPGMARNVGLWVGRIRRYVAHVRSDIERELHADELRQLMKRPTELEELEQIKNDLEEVVEQTGGVVNDAARNVSEAGREFERELRDEPQRLTTDSKTDANSISRSEQADTGASGASAGSPRAEPSALLSPETADHHAPAEERPRIAADDAERVDAVPDTQPRRSDDAERQAELNLVSPDVPDVPDEPDVPVADRQRG